MFKYEGHHSCPKWFYYYIRSLLVLSSIGLLTSLAYFAYCLAH